MNKKLIKDAIGWGFFLWLVGYVLGMILFFVLPPEIMGWVISPIGVVVTLWVLFKKVSADSLKYYVILSIAWTLLAIALDYIFIVKMLHPADGYYKLDVYIYYALTFALPLACGAGRIKKFGNTSTSI